MKYSSIIFLFIWTFESTSTISGEPRVDPSSVTTYIGGTATFRCSNFTTGSSPFRWTHSIGSDIPDVVYMEGYGVMRNYQERCHVELDKDDGNSSLSIRNISGSDAGTYRCETEKWGASADLIVIETRPECLPNIDLDHVLVENDCSIDPDRIELTCSVAYNGSRPPILEWRHSSAPQVIPSSSHSPPDGQSGIATSILTVEPDMSLNGSHYACSVKDVTTSEGGCGCMTKNISVMYLYNTTLEISTDNTTNLMCSANTSEACEYRWQATEVETMNLLESKGQVLPSTFRGRPDIRCLADCTIRLYNRTCTVVPLLLNSTARPGDKKGQVSTWIVLYIVGSTIFGVISIVTIVILITWKCNKDSRTDTLSAGNELHFNQVLRSKNGGFDLVLQPNQNLLLYSTTDNEPIWASETKGYGGYGATRAVMQADGNFVLRAGDELPFQTKTAGNPGACLTVRDDGTVAVLLGDKVLWSKPEAFEPPCTEAVDYRRLWGFLPFAKFYRAPSMNENMMSRIL